MFNTHERQTDRYCVDEQKESCNECEFTSETKADLEKHTSEVHHKDCVLSRHGEGTDKSKNSVEEVKMIFYCPFKCGFSNEEEDTFLIHLAENHDFSQSNYEACHLCTFRCTTKNKLAEHTSEVHQNGQKVDNSCDNHIISQVKADMKGLSHVKFKQLLAANDLVEVIVLGNGFCFLSTLLVTLGECGINKDMNNLSIEVMNEIRNNMEMYKEILPMESEGNILKTCEAFFQEGIYSHEFVDFCIAALANALGVNIHIFQRGTYRVTVTSINCHKFVSAIDIFCMFHKSKKSINNLDCHYNPYVESEYLKTHKEEIKSRFVLSTEEEAERDSRNATRVHCGPSEMSDTHSMTR